MQPRHFAGTENGNDSSKAMPEFVVEYLGKNSDLLSLWSGTPADTCGVHSVQRLITMEANMHFRTGGQTDIFKQLNKSILTSMAEGRQFHCYPWTKPNKLASDWWFSNLFELQRHSFVCYTAVLPQLFYSPYIK